MLETLLSSFNINVVNTIILLIIVAIFILGLVFTKKNKQNNFVNYIPTLLTTIGIFGTFIGIVLGLLHFDQNAIETSMPLLLAGLKTAFITSLVGIFFSLIFKTLATFGFLQPKIEEDQRYKVTPKDYLDAMQQHTQEIIGLKKLLGSENEPSLSYQINSLRTDMNANSQLFVKRSETQTARLNDQLTNLADTLAGMRLKTAIDDLNDVIVHFNLNLTEQFGNKFKYFNEGLAKTIEWQENYTSQFESMQKLYANASASLLQSEASMAQIAEHNVKIFDSMDDFRKLVEVTQYQVSQLEVQLSAFAEMREKAVETVPTINQYLTSTIDTLKDTVSSINEYHQNLLTESSRIIDGHIHASSEFIEQVSKETVMGIQSLKAANTYLIDDMEMVKTSLVQSANMLENTLTDMTKLASDLQIEQAKQAFIAMEQQIEQQASFTAGAVNSQLKLIDETMHKEINQVMSHMSQALTQISGQFVEDYSKLTAAMYRIINQHNKSQQQ